MEDESDIVEAKADRADANEALVDDGDVDGDMDIDKDELSLEHTAKLTPANDLPWVEK